MSGICGIVRFGDDSVSQRDVERMMGAIAHRGPDRRAAWTDGPAGLGHLLMRVTAEDAFDVQPLHDRDAGLTLVADLRLDNREELADAVNVEPDRLERLPDSALLMAAFKRWGADCVEHLIGDFLFAMWDARARTLVLARDHMGQRHCMFHHGDGVFAFATEVKGLWTLPDVPRALDETHLARYLLADKRPRKAMTPFAGICGIPGGTIMTVGPDGALASRRYWQPQADPAHLDRDEAYYVEAYRRVLGEAVACRLRRATQPAGMFFGGGFDSTAIAGLAGPVVTAQKRKLVCASSVMPEDYKGPIRHARKWVELCRAKLAHIDVRYVTREGLSVLDGADGAFLREEMPHSPNRYVNDALYKAVAGAGARVVLDGHGGDYTLNPRASETIEDHLRHARLRAFAHELLCYKRITGYTWPVLLRRLVRNLFPGTVSSFRNVIRGKKPAYAEEMVTAEVRDTAKAAGVRSRHDAMRAGRRRPRRVMMRETLERISQDAAMGGAIPAAHCGMEFTQPFHDKRVVEFALAIPEGLYFRNGHERYLAKRALADIYPAAFQTRDTYNDDRTPDFLAMVRQAEPQLLAEIARMETSPALARIFDFGNIRKYLTQRPLEAQMEGRESETIQAISKILWARYVGWFRRDNA
jgi:asparagine synthase (glutamine-hydrolysing)